ncbi:MAG TPA: site-2 protease family protein [Spirochaetota bacterium]|nr:site-2 protease family protein [Spirochaetota bacterium]
MSYITALAVLSMIILVHESGHFMAARACGIKIRIFSVGFGPALAKKHIRGTEFRISLFPIGGYVLPDIRDEKEFFAISPLRRIVFSIGGPAGNIAAAIAILSAADMIAHGFTPGGTVLGPIQAALSFFSHYLSAIPGMFSNPEKLSGIVGIVSQGGGFIGGDFMKTLAFAAMMNMNLALFNLLPFPVLDGGKILLYLLEKASPRTVKLHLPISLASWGIIVLLTVYVTVMDIVRLA